ncbi:MAG: hypothetical protein ACRD5I_13140 [Candidatus Acidiferrales bacterium]
MKTLARLAKTKWFWQEDQAGNQRRLAGSRLPDDVHVGAAVGSLDAEQTLPVAPVGFGKEGNAVVWLLRVH